MIYLILIMIKIQIMKNHRKRVRENKGIKLEPDHSDTDERDKIDNEEYVIRKKTQKEVDCDDLVNTDTDKSQTDVRDERKIPIYIKYLIAKKYGTMSTLLLLILIFSLM